MSIRKRNEFLEGDNSDEEFQRDEDSESGEESRAAISRHISKRRKVHSASDVESIGSDREDEDSIEPRHKGDIVVEAEQYEEKEEVKEFKNAQQRHLSKQAAAAQKAARKSGVVYISRVPPFMKPQTLSHFLAPHASKGLGRVFLTPEDHAAHIQRVKRGGNKKKSFTDGWVEFVSKREAKIAAATLNGNIIGGKKGNFYHDDLWNIKYLKGFKWSHLTEQIANENAERTARMREEIRRTRQDNKSFAQDFERGKMMEGRAAKRKAKLEREGTGGEEEPGRSSKPPNEFKQKKAQVIHPREVAGREADVARRVGRSIFG